MSRPPPSSRRHAGAAEVSGLADVLEPDADVVPSSRLLPVQIQDFAFADTVHANDELDSTGNIRCTTPLAFRLPPVAEAVDLRTRSLVFLTRVRRAVRGSREEMSELWADTDELVSRTDRGPGRHVRRLLALWSLFEWSRADVTRATLIGLAVFIVAGALGSVVIDLGDDGSASAASDEVRARHTIEQQHTGKRLGARAKR